ncbi:MAG: DUF1284 domain-containing protein [Bacillota bacterium]
MLFLRSHHLLCAEEFRGRGYSPAFVANFARILATLARHPETPVVLTAGPDDVCAACPWLGAQGCARSEEGEKSVSSLDKIVCARLGCEPGAVMSWTDLQTLLRSRADRAWRLSVCRGCSWFGSPCYEK